MEHAKPLCQLYMQLEIIQQKKQYLNMYITHAKRVEQHRLAQKHFGKTF